MVFVNKKSDRYFDGNFIHNFAVVVISKPIADRTTGIATNVLVILYVLIVFVTSYNNWPR